MQELTKKKYFFITIHTKPYFQEGSYNSYKIDEDVYEHIHRLQEEDFINNDKDYTPRRITLINHIEITEEQFFKDFDLTKIKPITHENS